MQERELFKKIIDKSLETNDMAVFNKMVVALISSHNNVTAEEIKKNCKSIQILIDILNDYSNKVLKDIVVCSVDALSGNKKFKNKIDYYKSFGECIQRRFKEYFKEKLRS